MADITQLYNIMTTATQQEALNDDSSQDYEVAQYKTLLDQAKREILTQYRLQANSYIAVFTKDANNEIRIPVTGILKTEIPASLRGQVVERQRGQPLWDRVNNVKWTNDIQLTVWADIDYPYLSEALGQWIAWRAAELLAFKLNGPDQTVAYVREQVENARMAALNSESISMDQVFDFNRIAASGFLPYQNYGSR